MLRSDERESSMIAKGCWSAPKFNEDAWNDAKSRGLKMMHVRCFEPKENDDGGIDFFDDGSGASFYAFTDFIPRNGETIYMEMNGAWAGWKVDDVTYNATKLETGVIRLVPCVSVNRQPDI
jgi:hypothetical protein